MRQTKELSDELKSVLKEKKYRFISRDEMIIILKLRLKELYKLNRVIEVLEFEKIITKYEEMLWKNNYIKEN